MNNRLSKSKKNNRTNKIYKNNDIEESKKYISRQNEIMTNRLLMLFGIAVGLVASLVYLMNITNYETTKLHTITFVCMFIFGAFLAASFILLIYRFQNGIDESDKTFNSRNIFGTAFILFMANLLIFFTYQKWIPLLTALTITVTALIYIYYLYQLEFFAFSVLSAIGCFLIYFGEGRSFPIYFSLSFKILLALIAVLVFAAALVVSRNKGFLLKSKVFDEKAGYFQFYILSAVLAVSAALVMQTFFSINFLYIIISVVACFVVVGIYYTVKMIY